MSSLEEQFQFIRGYTEEICEPLGAEDFVPQPVEHASPPKWHLAHTTWFFEEFILKPLVSGYKVFNPNYQLLFNSYYNTVGDRIARGHRGLLTRPTVKEVYAYRAYVNEHILKNDWLFESESSAAELIQIGLNHEQQHQELLLTDLKLCFSFNPLFPVYHHEKSLVGNDSNGSAQKMISIEPGLYEIGADGEKFCYDNELGQHKVYLNDFQIADGLVTVAEYLEFMKDGGYSRFDLWLDEGWAWLQEHNINSPMYWYQKEEQWFNYTLAGLQEVNPNAPMSHVNFYEAEAYARWAKKRLPTEFEWEIASNKFDWGERWEWTNSAYLPYPGFDVAPGALGEYNGKFMVNQMVLRGASFATSPGHSRNTYRNFFHPKYRWQLTGIRLAL